MKRFTIIVAGGSGQRFGSVVPKQFVKLAGKPILMHTMEKFFSAGGEIILVLTAEYIDYWKELCTEFSFFISHEIVEGGNTRTASVKNGLEKIKEEGVVAIHDAVRPLVSNSLVENLFSLAIEKGNAIPAVEVMQSMRKVESDSNYAVNRNDFRIIQTPQCFHVTKIKTAYTKISNKEFTDDASVYEAGGNKIFLAGGEYTNIKITGAQDLTVAEVLIKSGL